MSQVLLSTLKPLTRIKIFSGDAKFNNVVIYQSQYSFSSLFLGKDEKRSKLSGSLIYLVGWKNDEKKYIGAQDIKTIKEGDIFRLQYPIMSDIFIPNDIVYGLWLRDVAYIELEVFNDHQKCLTCQIAAPHIDTGRKEFVCDICKVLNSL